MSASLRRLHKSRTCYTQALAPRMPGTISEIQVAGMEGLSTSASTLLARRLVWADERICTVCNLRRLLSIVWSRT
jgi:hypothetical protein